MVCPERLDIAGEVAEILEGISHPEFSLPASPVFSLPKEEEQKDIFSEEKRKSWNNDPSRARTDLRFHPKVVKRAGVWFASCYQKSVTGRTLVEIKADLSLVDRFAADTANLIEQMWGRKWLFRGEFALTVNPPRRHIEGNFAIAVAKKLAEILEINFYPAVASPRSKQRINAVYDLVKMPPEENIIVFDDFVTTGSSLSAMKNLLSPHKNTFFITGVNNAF